MKRLNFPLLLGGVILIIIITMVFYPDIFTKNDPLFEESPRYVEIIVDGEAKFKLMNNPMPPNENNLMGTDDAGRDVYARLVYGAKNTMKLGLYIALFRMILALPLGLAAGMGIKFISVIIKVFSTLFTAFPMLLFSFLILNIGYFRSLQMDKSLLAFAVVLTIVGWAKLAGMIEDSTRLVMDEDFIEGEIAIGKNKFQIAYQNVLPHLIPTSVSLFFKEMGMGLFLVAQLAVLYVFVGVTRQIKALAFRANYEMILEPEWGGALSRIAVNIGKFNSTYWMTIYPILAFTMAIIGLNLLGEGLRIEFLKRDSRVISFIRKLYYLVSPRTFISQIMDLKIYYKTVIAKTLVIVVILGYLLIPLHPSTYDFNLDNSINHLQELSQDKYKGRVPGSEGGYLASQYIIEQLQSYGLDVKEMEIPYLVEKDQLPMVLTPLYIENGELIITEKDGSLSKYYLHKDFTITSVDMDIFKNGYIEEVSHKGISSTMVNIMNTPKDEKIIYVEEGISGLHEHQFRNANRIVFDKGREIREYDLKVSLLNGFSRNGNAYIFNATSIIPFGDLIDRFRQENLDLELTFDYPILPEYNGRNLIATKYGRGKSKDDPGEIIILGAHYDGGYQDGENKYYMSATPSSILLEVANVLSNLEEPLDKTIQFIFWDNDYDNIKYGATEGSYHYNLTEKMPIKHAMNDGYYYFDISYPGFIEDKYLNLITFPAQRADKNTYLMGLEIEKRMEQLDIRYRRFHYNFATSRAMRHMRLNALTSTEFGNPSTEWINTSMDRLDRINYNRLKEIGQIVIDTMTMNSYIMD